MNTQSHRQVDIDSRQVNKDKLIYGKVETNFRKENREYWSQSLTSSQSDFYFQSQHYVPVKSSNTVPYFVVHLKLQLSNILLNFESLVL